MHLLIKAPVPRVTTDATLVDDLRASLNQRGAPVGRTLGSFIDACITLGLTLDSNLASIEYGVGQDATGRIAAEWDADEGYQIRELKRSEVK